MLEFLGGENTLYNAVLVPLLFESARVESYVEKFKSTVL